MAIELHKEAVAINWLKNKLNRGENGIFLDEADFGSFDLIQNFLEVNDRPFESPTIYYEAFAGESAERFLSILKEELTVKLGNSRLNSQLSLERITAVSGLKMVILDKCYLYTSSTICSLWNYLSACGVCLILVGSKAKIKNSQILSHPLVSQFEQFSYDSEVPSVCRA